MKRIVMSVVAMLMITDKKDVKNLGNFKNQMMDEFLLGSEVLVFTDTIKRFLHESNMEELDYLMGVQGWRRFVFQCPTQISPKQANLVLGAITAIQGDDSDYTNEFHLMKSFRRRSRASRMEDPIRMNLMAAPQAAMMEEAEAIPPVLPERAMAMDMAERIVGRVAAKRKVAALSDSLQFLDFRKRPSTIAWEPAIRVEKGEIDANRWSVVLRKVATTYLVYVSFISDDGIQERTEEIQTKRTLYLESKLKTETLLLCEDDVMKLPFTLINNEERNVGFIPAVLCSFLWR